MAQWPDGIDMDALLAPMDGDSPIGPDLREDFSVTSIYRRLKDARLQLRDAERQEDAGSPREGAAEPLVVLVGRMRSLAIEAAGASRDLEVAAWLTEVLVRTDGARGLAAGAHLIAGLAAAFWDDNVWPPIEEGIADRVAPITGLNGEGGDGTLAQPLRKMPLYTRPDGSPMPFWQYKQSEDLATMETARAQARIEAGAVPMDTVDKEARAAGGRHFAALRESLRTALAEWTAMGEVLDAKAGMDGPPTRAVRELLEAMLAAVNKYAPVETAAEADAAAPATGEADAPDAPEAIGGGGMALPRGRLVGAVNREDMLAELGRIAEFFRKTEPQSPLGYTLEEAIRRGRMSWPELLAEIVSDTAVRDNILMQLGIRPPQPEGEAEGEGESSSGSW